MLATRSPHRPNNVGLSLVRIGRVDKKRRRLHVSALDMVNGTPVYDIKPVVPWDVPGRFDVDEDKLKVPSWVSDDDELKSVRFTTRAAEGLEACVRGGKTEPFYGARDDDGDGIAGAESAIREVLAQDPRASNSNGRNRRGSRGDGGDDGTYRMLFCSTEVEFRVDGDGAVVVESVRSDGLDLDSVERVDGIPILLDGRR